MQKLKLLWQGYLPLEAAFWQYAILYGMVLNIIATAAALFLVVLDVPVAYALIVHLSPIPYSILATVGVWRSAHRYGHQGNFALFAQVAVLAWFAFWLVA